MYAVILTKYCIPWLLVLGRVKLGAYLLLFGCYGGREKSCLSLAIAALSSVFFPFSFAELLMPVKDNKRQMVGREKEGGLSVLIGCDQ